MSFDSTGNAAITLTCGTMTNGNVYSITEGAVASKQY